MTPPILITDDDGLRDEMQRLAAAAGVVVDLVSAPDAVLRRWAGAPVVLVGADQAASVATLAPPRRDGVHVVSHGPGPDDLYRLALGVGAENVVGLPQSHGWVVETLADLGERTQTPGLLLGVTGGSGGAGATTLACALGQTAARHGEAVVIDCDPLGPGADRVLGLERRDGFRWDALCQTTGRLSARALREALPRRDRLGVLSWHAGSTASLQAFAVREALSASRRGHDTVVLDLPRSSDALVEEVAARCDLVLVVVAPTVAGVASAVRLCARHPDRSGLRLVVRGRGVDAEEIARATRVPLLATMVDQRGLAESIDLGLGPVRSHRGPLGRACATILRATTLAEAA